MTAGVGQDIDLTHGQEAQYRHRQQLLELLTAKTSPVLTAVRTVPAEKAAALETLIRGSWASNAVYCLCRLGVPDALSDEPTSAASAASLAHHLGCSAPCLLRLLRLCAAYGLLVEVPHIEVPNNEPSRDNNGTASARQPHQGTSAGLSGPGCTAGHHDSAGTGGSDSDGVGAGAGTEAVRLFRPEAEAVPQAQLQTHSREQQPGRQGKHEGASGGCGLERAGLRQHQERQLQERQPRGGHCGCDWEPQGPQPQAPPPQTVSLVSCLRGVTLRDSATALPHRTGDRTACADEHAVAAAAAEAVGAAEAGQEGRAQEREPMGRAAAAKGAAGARRGDDDRPGEGVCDGRQGKGRCREDATCFYLTDSGMMLQESHPSQMKWLALMLGLPGHYVSRGYLYDNVKEGRMGFEAAFGCDWYSYVGKHPLEATAFDKAMTATSTAAAQAVAQAYDFSRHGTVMDVGGGQGLLMTAILHHHRGVRRGYVLELPQVVAAARRLGQQGLERLEYVEGDFFQPFPRSVDCIVMRLVLHDWPDAQAAVILRHARAALAAGHGGGGGCSRLVVVEAVLPEVVTPEADVATLRQLEFDMGMMLMTSGRERSRTEWDALLASAGFQLEHLLSPPSAKLPIMVARVAAAAQIGEAAAAAGSPAGGS